MSGNTETAYRYTEYAYDSRGQITSYAELSQENIPTVEQVSAKKIRYTYDAKGKLTKVNYPTIKDGVQGLSYTYDKNGWLTKITASIVSGSNTKEQTLREYTYDSYGKVKEIKDYRNILGDGNKAIKKTYSYDDYDRVKEMIYTDLENSETIMEFYSYTYDKNSNILTKTQVNHYPKKEEDKINETKEYTYDSLGRLTKSITTNHLDNDKQKTNTYRYDGVGNRLEEDVNGIKTTYEYNGLDQVKTATKAKGTAVDEVINYSYDSNGNEISQTSTKTGETLKRTYDAKNQLSTVSKEKDGQSRMIQTNDYNGDGQRIQKTEGGKTTLVKEDGTEDATYTYTDFGETSIKGDNTAGNESDTHNLYVYCANNPINYVDPSGHKKKLIGAGLQISVSAAASFVEVGVGVEIVWFFKQIKGLYAYWYLEGGISASKGQKSFNTLYKKISKNPKSLLSKPKFSCSICAFAAFSNKKNKTARSYTKWFSTKNIAALGYKGFESKGGGFRTIGAGKYYGDTGVSVSKSYYRLIGNVGKKFNKIKHGIKKKAKKYFGK